MVQISLIPSINLFVNPPFVLKCNFKVQFALKKKVTIKVTNSSKTVNILFLWFIDYSSIKREYFCGEFSRIHIF